jgi:hypothetical protein
MSFQRILKEKAAHAKACTRRKKKKRAEVWKKKMSEANLELASRVESLFSACFLLLIFGDTMVWCKLLLYFDILFRSIFARVKVRIFLMQIQFFG